MENLNNFSSYVYELIYQNRPIFGPHMTPAEFYVSSDALVYL